MKKKPIGVLKSIGCLILLSPVILWLYLCACLAWIAYWPLPPIPSRNIGYSITDVGTDEMLQSGLYSNEKFKFLNRSLTANGQMLVIR